MFTSSRLLVLGLLILFLSACGGGGGNSDPAPTDIEITGGAVKGPLANALVTVYSFDPAQPDFKRQPAITSSRTNEQAAFAGLVLPGNTSSFSLPLIVEITSDAQTIDLTTGQSPAITRLRTVVTESMLAEIKTGEPLYVTPLTTLAFDLAVTQSNSETTAESFSGSLVVAANFILSTVGVGLPQDTDIFMAVPVLTVGDTSLNSQSQVAEVRTTVEALSAIVVEIQQAIRSTNPDSSVSTDQIMEALAVDLADGLIDGLDNGAVIPALRDVEDIAGIIATDPATLMVPGTSISLNDIEQVLIDQAAQTCGCDVATVTNYLADGTVDVSPAVAETAVDEAILGTFFDYPRVVSAISTGNRSLVVTFSKAMAKESAENSSHYSIVQANQNAEVGALSVQGAVLSEDSTSVTLNTSPQNEVTYTVLVTNVKDTEGRQLSVVNSNAGTVVVFNSAEFAGTPPTSYYACSSNLDFACEVDSDCSAFSPTDTCTAVSDFIDSDGDGLTDDKEVRGYTVNIAYGNGYTESREVTSDPYSADTDGDGLSDKEELQFGANPRDADTDGDGISDTTELNVIYSSPFNADTDGDGFEDGLEYYSFRTSVILADTDGDQLSDYEEIMERNRNPRIADIPAINITVGEMRLQIDERYTYTDEQGNTVSQESSSNTTLASSSNSSYSDTNGDVLEIMGGADIRTGGGGGSFFGGGDSYTGGFEVTAQFSATNTHTSMIEQVSAQESQKVYEQSLVKGKELFSSSSVTREVVGASIDVDLSVANGGDLAFTVSNIEISVLQRSPIDSRRFIPVATLVSNSELMTGTPLVLNLGAFTTERGPLLFGSREVFPNLVETLMRSPQGLIFKVANFDITDELGRNFTFSNQIARDRTAGLLFDYGDASTAEKFQVATAGAIDVEGFSGGAGQAVGGFLANGAPKAMSLDYLLQEFMGLRKNDTSTDGIVAGPNQTAESIAEGDDIQLIPAGTSGLSVGDIVIAPGNNGVLDSSVAASDVQQYISGYETSLSCGVGSTQAGNTCQAVSDCDCSGPDADKDSRCNTNPPPVYAGSCNGPEKLVRVKNLRNGDFNRGWVVLSTGSVPAGANFGDIALLPGEDIMIAFLQDLDKDGVFARDEFIAGSIDSTSNNLNNASFGIDFDLDTALVAGAQGDTAYDSIDTDGDGIADFAEINTGWSVSTETGLYKVYSSPRLADSDGDGLTDLQEKDMSVFCINNDPREGLCVLEDTAYKPAATDPSRSDTDNDSIADGIEVGLKLEDGEYVDPGVALRGYPVGLAIIDGGNGVVDSTAQGDDIQRGVVGDRVLPNSVIIFPGANGDIDSDDFISGDDTRRDAVDVVTDPLRRDTDSDTILDGIELAQGSNPTEPDGTTYRDSDNDGLTDAEESVLGWDIIVNNAAPRTVKSSPSLPDTDFDGLPDYVERRLGIDPRNIDTDSDGINDFDEVDDFENYVLWTVNYSGVSVNGSDSMAYGTDPNNNNSDRTTIDNPDGDTLTDYEELIECYRVLLPGQSFPSRICTNPLLGDTDYDGLSDDGEIAASTDATNADTDGDGRRDGAEVGTSDPLIQDVAFRFIFRHIIVNGACSDYNANGGGDGASGDATQTAGELMWFFTVNSPTGTYLLSDAADAESLDATRSMLYPTNAGQDTSYPGTGYDYTQRACYSVETNQGNMWLNFDKQSPVYTLKQGDSIQLRGLVAEADGFVSADCGMPNSYIPSIVSVNNELQIIDKTYFYEDLASSSTGITLTDADANPLTDTDECKIQYKLDLEIIR